MSAAAARGATEPTTTEPAATPTAEPAATHAAAELTTAVVAAELASANPASAHAAVAPTAQADAARLATAAAPAAAEPPAQQQAEAAAVVAAAALAAWQETEAAAAAAVAAAEPSAEKEAARTAAEDDATADSYASAAAAAAAAAEREKAEVSSAIEAAHARAHAAAQRVQAAARGRSVSRSFANGTSDEPLPSFDSFLFEVTSLSRPPPGFGCGERGEVGAETQAAPLNAGTLPVDAAGGVATARLGAPSHRATSRADARAAATAPQTTTAPVAEPAQPTDRASSRASVSRADRDAARRRLSRRSAASTELSTSRRFSPASAAHSPLPPVSRRAQGSPEAAHEWASTFAAEFRPDCSASSWLSAGEPAGRDSAAVPSGSSQWAPRGWRRGALEAEPLGGSARLPPMSRPSRSSTAAAHESRSATRGRLEGAPSRKLPPALVEASVHNRERGRLLSDMGLLTSASSSLRVRRADAPPTRATSPPLRAHGRADTLGLRAGGGSVILQHALARGEGAAAPRSTLPRGLVGRSTAATLLVQHGRVW